MEVVASSANLLVGLEALFLELDHVFIRVPTGVSPNPGKPGSPDNFEPNPELEPRIEKTGVFGFEFSLKKLFFPEFFGIFRNFSEFLGNFRKFSVLLKKYFGLGMYYVVRTSKISLLYIHCVCPKTAF